MGSAGSVAVISGQPAATYTLPVRIGTTFTGATELTGDRDGVRYRIRASTNLTNWNLNVDAVTPALTAGLPAVDVGWEYRTFRIPGAVNSEVKVFFRTVIESAP